MNCMNCRILSDAYRVSIIDGYITSQASLSLSILWYVGGGDFCWFALIGLNMMTSCVLLYNIFAKRDPKAKEGRPLISAPALLKNITLGPWT